MGNNQHLLDVAEKRQLVLRKDQKYNSDQPRRSSRIKAATAAKQEYTAALRAHKEREEELNERYSELLEEEWEENQRYSDWESGRVASEERTLEWKKPTKEKVSTRTSITRNRTLVLTKVRSGFGRL
jgi:hypothetical protein